MKKLTLVVGVASIVFATSCKKEGFCKKGKESVITQIRDVADFTTVNSEGSFDVYITQNESLETGMIEVEAASDLMEYIETEVNNGVLTIDSKKCFRTDKDIKIFVSSKMINDISLSGSGNIESKNTLTPSDMKITLSGSGNIDTDLDVNSLDAKITGSGNVKTIGTVSDQELKITGSGNIEHFGLSSETAMAKITGSGNIEVNASDALDVVIDGSGNVSYIGNAKVTSSIDGSGKVLDEN